MVLCALSVIRWRCAAVYRPMFSRYAPRRRIPPNAFPIRAALPYYAAHLTDIIPVSLA